MRTRERIVFFGLLLAGFVLAGILPNFPWFTVQAQPVGGRLRSAQMDYNTSGTHAVVAGVVGQRTRVYQLTLFCNGANNVTLQDSTPAVLHPVMNFSASQGMVLDYHAAVPWFTTALGTDFVLNLSANQPCSGVLWYTQGPW